MRREASAKDLKASFVSARARSASRGVKADFKIKTYRAPKSIFGNEMMCQQGDCGGVYNYAQRK